MHQLPSNPSTLRGITPDEYYRLESAHSDFPPRQCLTCSAPLPSTNPGTFFWYEGGDPDAEVAEYVCDCEEQTKLYISLLSSGLGVRYQRLGWLDAHSVSEKAQQQVLDYMSKAPAYVRRGIGLVLYGEIGAGKTLLSTLWLKGMIAKGYSGVFSSFAQIMDMYQTSWRKDDEKRAFERRIVHAPLLVIDDIGRENAGRLGVAGELVDRVLRTRVDHQRPTVVTTNKDLGELAELYSLNALSLLDGCAVTVKFDGEDFRPKSKSRDNAEIDMGLTRPLMLA